MKNRKLHIISIFLFFVYSFLILYTNYVLVRDGYFIKYKDHIIGTTIFCSLAIFVFIIMILSEIIKPKEKEFVPSYNKEDYILKRIELAITDGDWGEVRRLQKILYK